tara:strand:+ start:157 stop:807 length:651 start_codon:yes stop_codon:yes gene_type:complete
MKVHTLNIDSSQRDTSIYPDSNNYVVTLENPIYDVEEIRLVSARIPTPQTPAPNSLILKLSSGSDELNQSVYVGTPHYTGHILLDGTTNITFNGSDDPFVHRFHSGSQKIISDLGLEFLYFDSGTLTRYRFNNEDHVLKFEVKCSTDKLEGLTKVPLDKFAKKKEKTKEEKVKNLGSEILYNQEVYIYIGIIAFFGIVLMFLMKGSPKLPPVPPPT